MPSALHTSTAEFGMNGFVDFRHDHPRRAAIISALLAKISKHLALLACLMIVGKASGRFASGEFTVFLVIALASAAHLCGRALAPRSSRLFAGRP